MSIFFRPAFRSAVASSSFGSTQSIHKSSVNQCCRRSFRNDLRLGQTRTALNSRKYSTKQDGPSIQQQAAGKSTASSSSQASQNFKTRQEMYKQKNQTLLMYSVSVVLIVSGLSYAAVPLYRVFCASTGFAGTPIVASGKFAPERLVPAQEAHRIKVVFNSDTSEALPWQFVPQQKYVSVLPGETSLAFYKAKNVSSQDVIGIATYNVTPDRVAPYFAKVECFCFEEQKLLAGEEVDMPLLFFIDRDILDDPACQNVDNVVLSYTFFRARRNERGHLEPDAPDDVVQKSLGFDEYEHKPKPEERSK